MSDDLDRGKGDPDVYGYPGENDPRWVGQDKVIVQRQYAPQNRRDGYPWSEDVDYNPLFDEDLERSEDD